jgi:hypothetical protein
VKSYRKSCRVYGDSIVCMNSMHILFEMYECICGLLERNEAKKSFTPLNIEVRLELFFTPLSFTHPFTPLKFCTSVRGALRACTTQLLPAGARIRFLAVCSIPCRSRDLALHRCQILHRALHFFFLSRKKNLLAARANPGTRTSL